MWLCPLHSLAFFLLQPVLTLLTMKDWNKWCWSFVYVAPCLDFGLFTHTHARVHAYTHTCPRIHSYTHIEFVCVCGECVCVMCNVYVFVFGVCVWYVYVCRYARVMLKRVLHAFVCELEEHPVDMDESATVIPDIILA